MQMDRTAPRLEISGKPPQIGKCAKPRACDELAAWRYPEAWDMLMFGMRLGADPRTVVVADQLPLGGFGRGMRNPVLMRVLTTVWPLSP